MGGQWLVEVVKLAQLQGVENIGSFDIERMYRESISAFTAL
jgi:hypothetical protein